MASRRVLFLYLSNLFVSFLGAFGRASKLPASVDSAKRDLSLEANRSDLNSVLDQYGHNLGRTQLVQLWKRLKYYSLPKQPE